MTQLIFIVHDEETAINYAKLRLVKLADHRRTLNKTVRLIENEDKEPGHQSVILHPGW